MKHTVTPIAFMLLLFFLLAISCQKTQPLQTSSVNNLIGTWSGTSNCDDKSFFPVGFPLALHLNDDGTINGHELNGAWSIDKGTISGFYNRVTFKAPLNASKIKATWENTFTNLSGTFELVKV